jgi:acetoin utilization deacetylase AcuC-like enzyme
MGKTIIIKDDRYLQHITSEGHPENHHRLETIYSILREEEMNSLFTEVAPKGATKEELALIHAPAYIERIEKTAGHAHTMLDPDTHTSSGSWEAAILAAGGVVKALDFLVEGKADNGFALVRPPGHHAEASRAMGFCLFNNIAIGAKYLLSKRKHQKILIVDWDLHHGNGTQNAFYDSPEVLYFSIHQFPFYPGSGHFEEIGEAEGRGFTINVPLPGGQGDEDYSKIFEEILAPITEDYRPECVLVSAGYDTYYLDPLGAMRVTPQGFFCLASMLVDLAGKYCEGKILFALEGGYHLQGTAESVKQTIHALLKNQKTGESQTLLSDSRQSLDAESIIKTVKRVHSKQWRSLR